MRQRLRGDGHGQVQAGISRGRLAIALTCGGVCAQDIERISVDSDERQAPAANWVPLSTQLVSSGGRFVAFSSDADDLVADDTNGVSYVFLRDAVLGSTGSA